MLLRGGSHLVARDPSLSPRPRSARLMVRRFKPEANSLRDSLLEIETGLEGASNVAQG